jgi:hypothetical protein
MLGTFQQALRTALDLSAIDAPKPLLIIRNKEHRGVTAAYLVSRVDHHDDDAFDVIAKVWPDGGVDYQSPARNLDERTAAATAASRIIEDLRPTVTTEDRLRSFAAMPGMEDVRRAATRLATSTHTLIRALKLVEDVASIGTTATGPEIAYLKGRAQGILAMATSDAPADNPGQTFEPIPS